MGRKKHSGALEPKEQRNVALGVSGYQYRISFPPREDMMVYVQDIIDRRYTEPVIGGVVLQQAFPIMCLFLGLSETSYWQAQKSGQYPLFNQQNTISTFERELAELDQEDQKAQLLGLCYSYYYNSVRSTIGNYKSRKQAEHVKEAFKKFSDPRLYKALMLKEIVGHRLDPKSDGVLVCTTRKYRKQSHVHIFLRTGDCMGGSQRDRMGQIKFAAEKNPDTDFILIWDGLEVDHQTIQQINLKYPTAVVDRGAVYATTTDALVEAKILELFDRP